MDSPDYFKPRENTKYGITDITHPDFADLHRIVALRSVGKDVKAGDLGGYVQSESNLSFDEGDDAWIYDDAIVGGSAYVGESSQVRHHAVVANFAVVKSASVVCGNAVVKENAIVRSVLMGNHAVAKGSAYVSFLEGTHKAPILCDNCEVSGTVQGDVNVSGATVIEPGEEIINLTEGNWTLTERNHKQKEPMVPEESLSGGSSYPPDKQAGQSENGGKRMDTPEEVIPNYPILTGTRPLMPAEVSFVYGVHRQDELLQFTLNKLIAVEEVFGLGPDQDEDVTVFAYYDLKQGVVRDTLDVKVLDEDDGKQYYGYRLRPEESALLLTAMAAYCREKTGMSLEMQTANYQEEHSASAVPVEDTETAGTRRYFTSPDYRIRPKENSKFGITDIAHPDDKELHRIVALRNIGTEVKAGDLGGYVQSQGNLSYQNGDDAWIYDDAIVKGFAFVADNSQIRNHAEISGFANVGGAALICGHAVVTDNAQVHGALLRDYAVVSGHSFVGLSQETNLAPALLGNCEVRGSIHGFVRISGRVAVSDQENINNDTEKPLEVNNQNHLQKGPGSYLCGRRRRGKNRQGVVK